MQIWVSIRSYLLLCVSRDILQYTDTFPTLINPEFAQVVEHLPEQDQRPIYVIYQRYGFWLHAVTLNDLLPVISNEQAAIIPNPMVLTRRYHTILMMTSSNRSIFRVTCLFVRRTHWSPVDSLAKATDKELWIFLWSARKTYWITVVYN